MKTINLLPILNRCKKGTILWSPLYGDVKLDSISKRHIIIKTKSNELVKFLKDGKLFECNVGPMLYPSKDCQDWSKFVINRLKDGDIIAFTEDSKTYVLVYKKCTNDNNIYYYACSNGEYVYFNDHIVTNTIIRYATLKEKEQLFSAIEWAGGMN